MKLSIEQAKERGYDTLMFKSIGGDNYVCNFNDLNIIKRDNPELLTTPIYLGSEKRKCVIDGSEHTLDISTIA